jgi:hypothetical protein
MERQITISIEEYNKLIDMHTKREELPERIEVTSDPVNDIHKILVYNKNPQNPKFDSLFKKIKEDLNLSDISFVKLNHVIKWHSLNGRDKYSHFEISKGEAYFSIYDGDEKDSIIWNLDDEFLHTQSQELIEFLHDLI